MLPVLLLAVTTLFASIAVAADCIFADGSRPKDKDRISACSWTQPNLSLNLNTCCVIGDACLDNGICMRRENSKDDRLYVGACASKRGGLCAEVCPKKGEIIWLESCHTGTYVCGDKNKCGEDRGGEFNMGEFYSIAGTVLDPMGIPIPPHSSSSSSSSSSSRTTGGPKASSSSLQVSGPAPTSSSLNQTTTLGSDRTTTQGVDQTASPGTAEDVVAPDVPSNSTDNSTTAPDNQHNDHTGTIPLAVGVSIGGLAIAAAFGIGLWMWRERKRREPARADTPPPTTMAPLATAEGTYYGDPREALRHEAFRRMHGF